MSHLKMLNPSRPVWLFLAAASAACAQAAKPVPAATLPDSAPFAAEIRDFAAADRVHPPPKHGLLFVGSSSVRMWESLATDFPRDSVINRGFGGSELSDVVRYADRIVIPHEPRIVVVYAGDNDLAAGKSPERVLADYRALVELLRARLPSTPVVFVSIKPSLARAALVPAMRRANALVEAYTRADPRLRYADVFTPMLGADGTPRAELFGPDGLHMNAMGYALWTRVLTPLLR